MGKNINTVSEENDKDYKYDTGLSMIGDYSIICHYRESLDEQIKKYIAMYNNPVLALSERCGMKVIGNRAKVIGYDPMVVFGLNKKKDIIGCGAEIIF
jgi:dipeptidase E